MEYAKCDAKGRLYLRDALRREFGDRFVAVPATGQILLIPVPEDPVAELRDATAKVRGISTRKLKSAIREAARQQVGR